MIQDFINQENGQLGVGDTPQNEGECVGLVMRWLVETLGQPRIWGNACDLPANADPNAYVVTPNSDTYVPAPGDVVCWPAGWGGSPVGHTAIVAPGTDVNTLHVFEQNDRIGGGDGRCRLYAFDYSGNPVFIHPKVLDQANNQGGEEVIQDADNEYYRWAKVGKQIRGRDLSRDEFRAAAVGKTWLQALEILSDNPEADEYQARALAEPAIKADDEQWKQNAATLQAQLDEARKQVKSQQATIDELSAEVSDLKSKPAPTPSLPVVTPPVTPIPPSTPPVTPTVSRSPKTSKTPVNPPKLNWFEQLLQVFGIKK